MSAGYPARWGWHQLTDSWARRLVAGAHVAPGDLVLDIGAGTGAVTAHLVAAGELHPRRADLVSPSYAAARWANDRRSSRFHIVSRDRVPRSAFRPAAPADAAVVTVVRR